MCRIRPQREISKQHSLKPNPGLIGMGLRPYTSRSEDPPKRSSYATGAVLDIDSSACLFDL